MAPLARMLSSYFRVVEPFQRRSTGDRPLTVERHVEDLAEVISDLGGARPILVGSSWGAMLGLAFAAADPEAVAGVVLIGCGTFDEVARAEFHRALRHRMDALTRGELERLDRETVNADDRLRAKANLLLPLYCHDPETLEMEDDVIDAAANAETWTDMLRLQAEGVYPAAFSRIECPVLMLHGHADPHPGQLIRKSLEAHLPQLEYREWEACGHYPWVERQVKEEFLEVLVGWLKQVGPKGE